MVNPMMGGGMGGGAKSGGGGSKPEMSGGGWDWSLGAPLSEETDETYGGQKPGKAPVPKPPPAPDPLEIIAAQGTENRPNVNTPQGSLTWNKDPVTGQWTGTQTFSPELQELYNQQVGLLQTPMNTDYSTDATRMESATFDRLKGLLDPVYAQQERGLEQKLANQGLPMGGEAYEGEFDDFNRRRSEAYTGAALEAVKAGRSEQGRMFGQSLAGRQSQFNELAALLGGQQVAPPTPIDVTGPYQSQYQGLMNQWTGAVNNANAQNAQTQQGVATAAGLAAMLMMSSKRFKEDREEIDESEVLQKLERLPVERWKYIGDDKAHIGPFAEDFQELFGLGDGETIHVVDAIGVLMAAVKALSKKVAHVQ